MKNNIRKEFEAERDFLRSLRRADRILIWDTVIGAMKVTAIVGAIFIYLLLTSKP